MLRVLKLGISASVLLLAACGGGSSGTTSLQAQANATANQSPTLVKPNPDMDAHVGTAMTYDATQGGTTFSDPEGDPLTYSFTVSPDHGDFSFSGGEISGTPSTAGTIGVRITASDGKSSVSDDFDIVVTGTSANNPPVLAVSIPDQSATNGAAFSFDVSQSGTTFTDADGDPLTYSIDFAPDAGPFTVAGADISGTPTVNEVYTVTVTASDGTDSVSDDFQITVSTAMTAVQRVFAGKIDLAALDDYVTLNAPSYVRAPNTVNNPITNAGATLGRVLFYDPALSIDDTVACASCHQQANAFSDLDTVSNGVAGGQTGRHSMRLVNTIFSDEGRFFWDERAADLEDQVTRPIRDHNEHGFSGQGGRPDFDDLIVKLQAIDYYQELFTFVFGDETITEARMQSALAQFVNSIVSFDSKYDEGLALAVANTPGADPSDPFDPVFFQDFTNFTFDENEGKALYMMDPVDGGAGCRRCHADPVFSVFENSGHIGVIGVAGDPASSDLTNTKSPSLRDVFKADGSTNGPFMHDGSMPTMREVLDHYDNIPVPGTEPLRTNFLATIDPQLVEFGIPVQLMLTDIEKDQIETFMRTLTGTNLYTDEKWSNPF